MAEVFDDTEAFVGQVEEDHGGPQGFAAAPQQGLIQQVADGHHQKDEDFFEDAVEAPGAGQLSRLGGDEDAGEIVDDHKRRQADEKAVPSPQHRPENAAD